MPILTFEVGDEIGEPQPIDTWHQGRRLSISAPDFEGKSMKHATAFNDPENVRNAACPERQVSDKNRAILPFRIRGLRDAISMTSMGWN